MLLSFLLLVLVGRGGREKLVSISFKAMVWLVCTYNGQVSVCTEPASNLILQRHIGWVTLLSGLLKVVTWWIAGCSFCCVNKYTRERYKWKLIPDLKSLTTKVQSWCWCQSFFLACGFYSKSTLVLFPKGVFISFSSYHFCTQHLIIWDSLCASRIAEQLWNEESYIPSRYIGIHLHVQCGWWNMAVPGALVLAEDYSQQGIMLV